MNVEEVSSVVVDTAFHLHRDIEQGLLESVYEAVLVRICGWNVKCLLPLTSMACISTRDFASSRLRVSQIVGVLSSVLPYTNAGWEKRSIILNFLVSKLPAPVEEDLSRGILEAIDMDSYRVEKQSAHKILLPDEDAEIEPVPASGGGHKADPELDRLSKIIKAFNDQFGNIPWEDNDRVHRLITEEIPARVAADSAYRNAQQYSDKQNARIEHDKALVRVMTAVMKDDTELFKQFMDNEGFRRWMGDTVFGLTYPAGER